MSEKPPSIETKKVLTEQEQYDLEQERLFLEDYSPDPVEQLSPEQCSEKVRELEALFTNFEQKHNLDVLNAIQVTSRDEALANPVREAARADLPAIVALSKYLDAQSQIPKDVLHQLQVRYKRIQAAVGTINNGRLDHSIR
jgi:hypothetical protein